jgi:hypothetical protein
VTFRVRLRRTLLRATRGPVEPARTTTLPPVFVGGTGRSGTTVTGRLVGLHPSYHGITTEVRFLSAKGGLCDLVNGRTGMRKFDGRMRGRGFDPTETNGPHMVLEQAAIEAALDRLAHDVRIDPVAAGAAFAHRLLDPLAIAAGKPGWVEMTPGNSRVAPTLLRMFPDLRLIHTERDGRDIACSVVPLGWGPNDLDSALDWWAASLRKCRAGVAALPPGRALVLRMESLLVDDRDGEYARLLDFVGLTDDPAMRAYFEAQMTAERAHIGRWRTDVPADRLAAFEAHYTELAASLGEDVRAPGAAVSA